MITRDQLHEEYSAKDGVFEFAEKIDELGVRAYYITFLTSFGEVGHLWRGVDQQSHQPITDGMIQRALSVKEAFDTIDEEEVYESDCPLCGAVEGGPDCE